MIGNSFRLILILATGLLLWFGVSGFVTGRGVDPAEFINKYNEKIDSFKKTVVDGEVSYTLAVIPAELRIIQQYRKGLIDETTAQNLLKTKENSIEFMLQIEIPKNGTQEFLKYEADSISYQGRIEYFAFGFTKDIKVNFDHSTDQEISGYTFERNFGASPKGTITFYVDLTQKADNITLQFHDKVYGSGEQEVVFDLNEIKALPQLKKVTKWKNTGK